jgi:hypothetical protein
MLLPTTAWGEQHEAPVTRCCTVIRRLKHRFDAVIFAFANITEQTR